MESTTHLERLATRLAADGFETTPDGQDGLIITNPAAGTLRETIQCRPHEAGAWSFHWSWGPAIASVDDPELAARRIAHVLKAVDE